MLSIAQDGLSQGLHGRHRALYMAPRAASQSCCARPQVLCSGAERDNRPKTLWAARSRITSSPQARSQAAHQQRSTEPDKSAGTRFAGLPLLRTTAQILQNNLWTVLVAFLLCDGATWVLHRFSHRLTNLLATNLLKGVSAESLGNVWWITNDSSIANFDTGYQYIVFVVFLLVFPLNILLRTLANGTAILTCHSKSGSSGARRGLPPLRGLPAELGQHWGNIRRRWLQLWEVECLLAVRVIPLSGLSLLLLPLPWTLPVLMSLSATTTLAVVNGAPSGDALAQSQRRLKPVWKSIAWPYLLLVLSARALDVVKVAAFGALPVRLQRDLPELSILVVGLVSFVTFALCRMRDLLGLAAYQMTDDPLPEGPLPTKAYRPAA